MVLANQWVWSTVGGRALCTGYCDVLVLMYHSVMVECQWATKSNCSLVVFWLIVWFHYGSCCCFGSKFIELGMLKSLDDFSHCMNFFCIALSCSLFLSWHSFHLPWQLSWKLIFVIYVSFVESFQFFDWTLVSFVTLKAFHFIFLKGSCIPHLEVFSIHFLIFCWKWMSVAASFTVTV